MHERCIFFRVNETLVIGPASPQTSPTMGPRTHVVMVASLPESARKPHSRGKVHDFKFRFSDIIIAIVYHDSAGRDTSMLLSTPVSSCDVPAG